MVKLLFFHFRVMNLKLINEKNSLIITVSNWHGLRHSIKFFVFSLLCCKYVYDIYLSMLNFNGLCKFNNIRTRLQHASLYNYTERQIELCHMKWFNCEHIYRVLFDIFVRCLRLVLVYRLSYKFNNNLRKSKIHHKSNVFNVA